MLPSLDFAGAGLLATFQRREQACFRTFSHIDTSSALTRAKRG